MKSTARSTAALILIVVTAGGLTFGQQLMNRRDQIRGGYLANPQGIYGHYCAHCHGDDGRGGGRLWASGLSPSPPDLTALGSDKEAILAVIRDGTAAHGKSALCPPWGRTLSPANLDRLARYIASLADGGSDATAPADSTVVVSEAFPWLLFGLLLGELGVLLAILRRRRAE